MSQWVSVTFATSIFVGAFLLFQVQPLIAKFILPWFGGAAAVWTTCMLFYQTLLVGGYWYAHLLRRMARTRAQIVGHGILLAAALGALPIEPAADWKPLDGISPAWHIIRLLTATVGLPYLALAAASPLMQAWFSRACPERSPYPLYALSNAGAMLALLSYPVLFEPNLPLGVQSRLWSAGFTAFAGLNILCMVALWRGEKVAMRGSDKRPSEPAGVIPTKAGMESPQDRLAPDFRPDGGSERISGSLPGSTRGGAARPWRQRMQWLILTASASLLLLATTNMICQDIAVVPFLWVAPLSLYLLSFIICFGRFQSYGRGLWSLLVVLLMWVLADRETLEEYGYALDMAGETALYLAALFAACMLCHGECFRLRPRPERLTEFYLMIGIGGALGGLLAGVVAPSVFTSYVEWRVGVMVVCAMALLVLGHSLMDDYRTWKLIGLVVALPAAVMGAISLASADTGLLGVMEQTRNFHGMVAVCERNAGDPASHEILMRHGTTHHGGQFADPAKRRWPTAYYGEESGVGRALGYYREARPLRVGVVGLGVGTIAAYARPGDVYRFYELNPEVLRLARRHFTYLGDCRGQCEVVLGDGRLSLEREAPQNFDLLVLDAFSSDAIPVHLLTREAFELYRRHLAPGGVIAVHITNRHLRLAPVLEAAASHFGMKVLQVVTSEDGERLIFDADWMLITENDAFVGAVPGMPPPDPADRSKVTLWTDHHSSLLPLLKSSRLGP